MAAIHGGAALLLSLLLVGASSAAQNQQIDCPLNYWKAPDRMLFGGLQDSMCSKPDGAHCDRSGWWWEQCKNPTSSNAFGVCNEQQRADALSIAQQLQGGAPLKTTPCDLYPFLRGRTLWLIGDSHTKQLFKAMQCFLIDFWDQAECAASPEDWVNAGLNALPVKKGESKCIHLMGEGRICYVGAVLGTSLLENPQVAGGGVLTFIRGHKETGAKWNDIFVINFGVWHNKQGREGLQNYRTALTQLGEDYQRNKDKWPYLFFRETPMSHEKDMQTMACKPPPQGWGLDYRRGEIFIQPNARSASAQAIVRGGSLNAPAREILAKYNVPLIGGYALSVPLAASHPGTRGTSALDCLHFCSFGLPELITYELARAFRSGAAGVAPTPWVDPSKRLPCRASGGGSRRLLSAAH
ncbi:MAG: hypothetical protein J3K34DRAFT_426509 [Monoraphidium minutum]|nr:MAG: hypothetical protein J3K34DRAFT_426509 [Monoraphidium minutum]